jgi:hypothetical protein
MRYSVLAFVITGSLAAAQSVTNTYTTDINGRRSDPLTTVSTDHQVTEVTRSINGRQVPLEQRSERILREDANGSVTETTIRKFDQTGQLVSTEKVITEAQKGGSGSTSRTTTYRTDINGNLAVAERKTEESTVQGAVTNRQTVVERPTINDSFQTVEKRSLVSETANNNTHAEETVYRLTGNGDFYPAVRQISEVTKNGDQTVEKMAHYEPIADSRMQLIRQSVSTTTKHSDGSEVEQLNFYGNAVPGNVRDTESTPQLFEQQIIQRDKGPGGSVVETVSVRRPTVSDPKRLEPAQQISQTTCKGKCAPDSKP